MRRLLPPLAALTIALAAVMGWYVITSLMPGAGGLLPFDLRPLGYDVDAVRSYLTALSGTGRAVYLLEIRWLDTAFPIALGMLVAATIWEVTRNQRSFVRCLLCLPAFGYTVLDLLENMLVADLVRAGAERFSPGVVALASLATMLKSAFLISALCVLVAAWWQERRA